MRRDYTPALFGLRAVANPEQIQQLALVARRNSPGITQRLYSLRHCRFVYGRAVTGSVKQPGNVVGDLPVVFVSRQSISADAQFHGKHIHGARRGADLLQSFDFRRIEKSHVRTR